MITFVRREADSGALLADVGAVTAPDELPVMPDQEASVAAQLVGLDRDGQRGQVLVDDAAVRRQVGVVVQFGPTDVDKCAWAPAADCSSSRLSSPRSTAGVRGAS